MPLPFFFWGFSSFFCQFCNFPWAGFVSTIQPHVACFLWLEGVKNSLILPFPLLSSLPDDFSSHGQFPQLLLIEQIFFFFFFFLGGNPFFSCGFDSRHFLFSPVHSIALARYDTRSLLFPGLFYLVDDSSVSTSQYQELPYSSRRSQFHLLQVLCPNTFDLLPPAPPPLSPF